MKTIIVDGKNIPLFEVKALTTIKNKESGVVYKDDQEWKTLGIDPGTDSKRRQSHASKT
jgi:hypothetical protein